MRKKLLFIICLLMLPFNVFATNENSKVGYDMDKYICTKNTNSGGYQDWNVSTNGLAYFSHCIKATCKNNQTYQLDYYTDEVVNCLNGNTNPYYELYKSGCTNYQNNNCNSGDIKYCSLIMKYDCSRKKDGSSFTTTTTTKKTTSKKTTTASTTTTNTTTTTQIIINTKLKSLTLSKGSIPFNSDVYEYNLKLDKEDTSLNITAIPIDEKNTVKIDNNTDLVDGSIITITVTGSDNSNSIYTIKISKDIVLSNNAKLKSLNITNYSIPFDKDINEYSIELAKETNSLDINYETEDSNANVLIENNNNLVNGSKINIQVTAEDGTINNYYINIIIKEKSNFLGVLFIIILIIALLAGAYYLYIKLIANKGGDKYEYE